MIVLALITWNIVNNFIISGLSNLKTNLVFSVILIMVGAFFAISSMDFISFKEKLLKFMKYIAIISIIVLILDKIFDLPVTSILYDTDITLFMFNCHWGEFRLSSIFWEPGQYQILIIYTLALFSHELINISRIKYNIRQFIWVVLALFLTISTTGYLCFIIIVVGVFLNMKVKKKQLCIVPIGIIIIGIFLILMYRSNAIQEKLLQMNSDEVSSYSIRSNDNMEMLQSCIKSPYRGYGLDSKSMDKEKIARNIQTSSNGWLYFAMGNGFPYVIILFLLMYVGIKRYEQSNLRFYILFALIVSQCNEWMAFFPYIYMYIFRYRKYELNMN